MTNATPRFFTPPSFLARVALVVACVGLLSACGGDDDEHSAAAAPEASETDTAIAADDSQLRCPGGEALLARVRALQAKSDPQAQRRWVADVLAGPERSGCASFKTLDDDQTKRYVTLLYNGDVQMSPALALHQTPAAQKAILHAYREVPDAVTDNAGLAAAVAMAQIQQGKSYEAAYRDLAFAALNDGIDAGYVRGYLTHFGCGYEDAVWAAKTRERIDFLAGDAFPASTRAGDTQQSQLIEDRMALLKQGEVPQLRADCPLSTRYAADHNGDTLTRLKLKAQQLSDSLRATFDGYAERFSDDDSDNDNTGDAKPRQHSNWTLEKFERQMAEQYAALEDFARQSGELASARWQYCANRFDRSFDFEAIADCVKAQPRPADQDNEQAPDKR